MTCIVPMPFNYMGTGYKTERARELRSDFQRPQRAFVAPGFPVETFPGNVSPPPPPTGVIGGAAAGAGGAALVGTWALPGGILAGLGIGAWVKTDIDKFKRESVLPFYDTNYDYRGGPGWQSALNERPTDWWDVDYDEEYDQALREWIQTHAHPFPTKWVEGGEFAYPEVVFPSGFYSPDDTHAPVYYDATSGAHRWWKYVHSCPANPAATHWVGQVFASNCPGIGNFTLVSTTGNANCANLFAPGANAAGLADANSAFYCPVPPQVYSVQVAGFSKVGTSTVRVKEAWLLQSSFTGFPVTSVPYGQGRIRGLVELSPGFASPLPTWRQAVAPVGTQPSLEQQQAPAKLPRGKSRYGYYVPFRLDAPVTVIRTGPGERPVTVPDVVIGPQPGGGVGPVLTPPTHPPDVGEPPKRGKEKKLNIRSGFAGVVFLAVNWATEFHDAIEAFWKTLPRHLRSKPRKKGAKVSHVQMLQDLYDHFGRVKWDKGVENFVNNQIEDYAYGSLGRAASYSSRRVGVTTGLGRAVKAGGSPSLTLPEIHFADGEYGVSWGDYEIGY